ncbi:Zinc finger SWIM domain-containing protein 4, partial [Frankliniella fusca]
MELVVTKAIMLLMLSVLNDTDLERDDVQKNVYILLYQKSTHESNELFNKGMSTISSPIGQQPFLISPMKSKVPNKKVEVIEEEGEVEDLAHPLTWSCDSEDTEATTPVNSRREKNKYSSQLPEPALQKLRIKRTKRLSPKATSSQSSHDYNIIGNEIKAASPEMRSPVGRLKISRMKRLSPKANSAQSDHIYKVVRTPLKKIKILRSQRISPKAYSTQSGHVYRISSQVESQASFTNVECNNQNGNEDEEVLPPAASPQSDIFEKSFGTFCDLIDNNVNFDGMATSPPTSEGPAIWNVELYENEVEGGILPSEVLNANKKNDLIRWLQCRGIPSGGNKAELIKLVQARIDEGNSHILDVKVDNGFPYRMKLQKLYPKQNCAANNIPNKGWGPFVSVCIPKSFNYGHIYNYLVESAPQLPLPECGPSQEEVFDALESEDDECDEDLLVRDPFEDSDCPCLLDEKPLRRGMKFLKSEHVHSLSDALCQNTYHVKASVAPSMPGPDKQVGVSISSISGHVQDAYCSCKASALGRCSHVSALLLFILRHVKLNGYD